MQQSNTHKIHHLSGYSKQPASTPINIHNKYFKSRNQYCLERSQYGHGYELYRGGAVGVGMRDRAMSQVQLFTKLRDDKYGMDKQNNPNTSNLPFPKHPQPQTFTHLKSTKYLNQPPEPHPQPKLTQHQQQLLETLKLDKVNAIVRECMLSGATVRTVMRDGTILRDLDQEIMRILEVGDIGEETVAVKMGSVLESTAQYWEPYSKREDNPIPQPIHQDPLLNSQFLKKPILKTIPHIESTIKNLQSPQNNLQPNSSTFQSFNKNFLPAQQIDSGQENKIHVMEFTLGQLESMETEGDKEGEGMADMGDIDQENFTEREQGDRIIQDIMCFNQRVKGKEGKYQTSQFVEFSGIKQANTSAIESQIESSPQKRVLCFNRNKLPKGKAIKNKVMGHQINP